MSTDACFRYQSWISAALTPAQCTRCCWISCQWMDTGGNMWTVHGLPEARRKRTRRPRLSMSIPTRPTLVLTGWRRQWASAVSNLPTRVTVADRWEHIILSKKKVKMAFPSLRYLPWLLVVKSVGTLHEAVPYVTVLSFVNKGRVYF